MDRFFVVVSRANSLILLVLLLGGGILLGINLWPTRTERPLLIQQTTPDVNMRLRLEEAHNVRGTDTYYALLVSDTDAKSFSSSSYGQVSRNILFIRNGAGSASWLFPTNAQILPKITPLPQIADRDAPASPQSPVLAFYVEVIGADTDGDGGMGWGDAIDVAFTKPDGTQFTKVLSGVSRVLALDTAEDTEMVVIYQAGTELRRGRISLGDFKLLSSERIVDIPESL